MTTFEVDTGHPKWVRYHVLLGSGEWIQLWSMDPPTFPAPKSEALTGTS
jgi:hypothetical protein